MAQAVVAFTVANHGMEQAEFDLLLFGVASRLLEEEFLDHDILAVKEEDTVPRCPVAARSAGFLVVTFDVFRHLVMDDVADIALVDAHAEGGGRFDDLDFIVGKGFLHGTAHLVAETGMVTAGLDAPPIQFITDAVDFLARRRIDDPAVLFMLGNVGQGELHLSLGMNDAEIEVGPVEAADKNAFLLKA